MAKGTKASELRSKSDADLADFIKTTRNQLFEARFQNYTNRLDDTAKISRLRRDLARALTIQNERARSAKTAAEPAAKVEG